jgi:hypothetical protein
VIQVVLSFKEISAYNVPKDIILIQIGNVKLFLQLAKISIHLMPDVNNVIQVILLTINLTVL